MVIGQANDGAGGAASADDLKSLLDEDQGVELAFWRDTRRLTLFLVWRYTLRAVTDLAALLLALAAMYLLRFDFNIPQRWYVAGLAYAPFVCALTILSITLTNVYPVSLRYFCLRDLWRLIEAITAAHLVSAAVVLSTNYFAVPRSILVGHWAASCVLLGAVRLAARHVFWWLRRRRRAEGQAPLRTLVVGSAEASETVIRLLLERHDARYLPVGFVEWGAQTIFGPLYGLSIGGSVEDIPQIVSSYDIEVILIVAPSDGGARIRKLLEYCERTPARVKIVPSMDRILSDDSKFLTVRDVRLEDLLRRPEVSIDRQQVAQYLRGRRVLVTGGGGSIGSEICRQVAELGAREIIVVGRGENSVFEVTQELRDRWPEVCARPIICDIRNHERLEQIVARFRPEVIFHTAAHKHVPLMEENPEEALENNIVGTQNVLDCAIRYGVQRFVHVSTDKAIEPTSVMGATKRISEALVQIAARKSAGCFGIVRFGNVLGSRGSVVQIFNKQIQRGGPVKVTDPRMVRYFMTIPEAVRLILQAGAMCSRGEIFTLNMGEPVKIVDLAKDLIRLHGYTPGKDIEIQFTGARPGEKLAEKMLDEGEPVEQSGHPMIFCTPPREVDERALWGELDQLLEMNGKVGAEPLRERLVHLANNLPCADVAAQKQRPTPSSRALSDGAES